MKISWTMKEAQGLGALLSSELARKLCLTAAVLGCRSRKDLAARFSAINPRTDFDLVRSYKWLQGRAAPRSERLYADWAALIGAPEGARWLGECSAEELLDYLCSRFSVGRDAMVAAADAFGGANRPDQADYLVGAYVAYSWAWSPLMQGRLIRGRLTAEQVARGSLRSSYTEDLPQAGLRFEGPLVRHGHGLVAHLDLVGGGGGEGICAHLLLAGWPAGVLCGHFVGMVVHGADSRRAVSRVVLFRITGETHDPERHGYIDATRDAVAADLAQHGFVAADRLAAPLLGFLGGAKAGVDYVTAGDCAALAEACVAGDREEAALSRTDR